MAVTIIRRATADDCDALAEIERLSDLRYLDSEYPELAETDGLPVEVALRYVERRGLLVAAIGDRLVGFIAWHREPDRTTLGVAQVSVLPAYGRRGIGTALLTAMLTIADDDPTVTRVALNTQRGVPWNEPWYARQGFTIVDPTGHADWMREAAADQQGSGVGWARRVWMVRDTRSAP